MKKHIFKKRTKRKEGKKKKRESDKLHCPSKKEKAFIKNLIGEPVGNNEKDSGMSARVCACTVTENCCRSLRRW